MYRYIRAIICVIYTSIKFSVMKLFEGNNFKYSWLCVCSPLTEVDIRNGKLIIGKNFKMRSHSHLRVRKNALLQLGDNVSFNYGNMIVSHEKIIIGDDVQFGPNVLIYDHDHDYRAEGGIKSGKFKTSPVIIGNNVWIGANTMILRGSVIGDNCIIGAGSVVKGEIPPGTIYVQKRIVESHSRKNKM